MNSTKRHFPHRYPLWIYGFFLFLVLLMSYSSYALSSYIKSGKNYHLGKIAYQEKHYQEAIAYYEQALSDTPSAKKVKFELAKAYFSTGNNELQKIGLRYLTGMRLDKYQYAEIQKIMPSEYEQYFKAGR